jgi:hypothetical protein
MLSDFDRDRGPDCISDLLFDEWEAGELSESQIRYLEAHLAGCARCAARKTELAVAARAFLEKVPSFSPPVAPVRKKARARWFAGASAALAVAAAAVLYLRSSTQGVRTKSGPRLGFYVMRGTEVSLGADGEHVRAGNRLRFTFTTTEPRHLAIVSLDARGAVRVYWPLGEVSTYVEPGANVPLTTSVRLEDGPGEERVFGIFCSGSIDVGAVRETLTKRHELGALPGCTVDSLRLEKNPAQ